MKKIIVLIISTIIGLLILWGILIFWSYKYEPDPREKSARFRAEQYDKHKILFFENNLDSTEIRISFYFNYSATSNQDSASFNQIDTEPYVINKDTLYLIIAPRKFSNTYETLPIFKNDSISFPDSFHINIYDNRNQKFLKELDYNSFKEYAIAKGITNKNDFLSANEWTLVIDSTLLGLK